jgi:APA family basic amino acid/polyamine antiporter
MLVMGGIIGVGIFFTPHKVAAGVPATWPFIGTWMLGGLMALTGAMTFAELAATFPRAGGWFVFLREAFGRFPAFLFAWIVLLVISTGAPAVVTHSSVGWIGALLFAGGEEPAGFHTGLGLVVIAGLTGVCLAGLTMSKLLQNAVMLLKLAAIAVFIFAGLVLYSSAQAEPLLTSTGAQTAALSWRNLPEAMLAVLFACGGWQLITYIAPNVDRPQRNLPLAILLGVAGVVLVYVLMNLSFLRVLGIEGLASTPDFAAEVGRRTLGPAGEKFLLAFMGLSSLGVCAAIVMATPGLYVAMAHEGLFFRRFGELSPRTGAPVAALLCQGSILAIYFLLGTEDLLGRKAVDDLTAAVVFAEWIFHALVGLALLQLRRTRPTLPRPFKSWAYPLFPVTYTVLATLTVVGSIWLARPERTLLGLGVLGIGVLVYAPWRRFVDARTRVG